MSNVLFCTFSSAVYVATLLCVVCVLNKGISLFSLLLKDLCSNHLNTCTKDSHTHIFTVITIMYMKLKFRLCLAV